MTNRTNLDGFVSYYILFSFVIIVIVLVVAVVFVVIVRW